jgi:hypothetical protein
MSEHQIEPGFVKNKIKSKNRPNRGSRARKGWRGPLAKVIKKSMAITELMTGEDAEEDLRILREAKKATHRVFNFETKKTEEVPDHRTRLAAFALSRAYHEGKPIERQIQLQGDFEDLGAMLERARNSPEAMRLLGSLKSLQSGPSVGSPEKRIEGRVIENEASPDAEK